MSGKHQRSRRRLQKAIERGDAILAKRDQAMQQSTPEKADNNSVACVGMEVSHQKDGVLARDELTSGEGGKDVIPPMPRKDRGMSTQGTNWQHRNRAPVEKTVSEDHSLIDPSEDECDIAEETVITTVAGLRDPNPRIRMAAVRSAIQLLRTVQSDDHAKLRAELRPTTLAPQVVIDQSTHNDNRRVMLMIPNNGRDPSIYAAVPTITKSDNQKVLDVATE